MKLLDDIIELLQHDDGGLGAALVKGQILAHKIGDAQLKQWVLAELNGYPSDNTVPEYRRLETDLIANVANLRARYTNYPLSSSIIPEEHRKDFLTIPVRDSIKVVESLVDKPLGYPVDPVLYGAMNPFLGGGFQIESASKRVAPGAFQQIVVEVRSRFLGMALDLADKLPKEPVDAELKSVGKEFQLGKYISHATFGDNVTINFGDGNTFSHVNTVTKGDFAALTKELESHGVSKGDIAELQVAIQQDGPSQDVAKGALGPKVRAWIGSMVAKAGTAAWDISIQTGAGVLAMAIGKYYGFG
ncbi:hypothetical protein [Cupriavidus sp. H39]|uniref:AbiTii domain-containing protein n=1 Tax=Cupriavidus sp. H39 TaxID=3401635 RepID=UPI003D03525F